MSTKEEEEDDDEDKHAHMSRTPSPGLPSFPRAGGPGPLNVSHFGTWVSPWVSPSISWGWIVRQHKKDTFSTRSSDARKTPSNTVPGPEAKFDIR